MAEYIDREKIASEVKSLSTHSLNEWDTLGVLLLIDRQPAADVAPVVHAHWTIEDIYTYELLSYGTTAYEPVYECSACKRLTESYLRLDEPIMPVDADFPRYCPNCGAKMDERSEGE